VELEQAEGRGQLPVPKLSVRLRGGDERFTLTLRVTHRARQLAILSRIISGDYQPLQISLYRVPVSGGGHAAVQDRAAGGGSRRHYRIMVRLAVYLPKRGEERQKAGTLYLATGDDCLWRAWTEGRQDQPWVENADAMRQRIAQYDRRRRRHNEDLQNGRRRSRRQAVGARDLLAKLGRIQHHQLQNFIHQSTARITGFAKRHRLEKVVLDATIRGYFPSFPYARLFSVLREKLEAESIGFEEIGTTIPPPEK